MRFRSANKSTMALVLALALVFTGMFGGIGAAYAADSDFTNPISVGTPSLPYTHTDTIGPSDEAFVYYYAGESLSRTVKGKTYAVTLAADTAYVITLTGDGDLDPYLLLNSADGYIDHNDDAIGSFNSKITFKPASTGTYYIIATSFYSALGYSAENSEYSDEGSYTLTIDNAPGGGINGTITKSDNSPVADAYIELYQRYEYEEDDSTYYYYDYCTNTNSDESGAYSFWGLEPGEYKIVVDDDDYVRYSSDATSDNTDPITVTASPVTHDITLSEGYSISGTVTSGNGAVVGEAYVALYQRIQYEDDGETYYYYEWCKGRCADENGAYRISGLESGDYRIRVNDANYMSYSHDIAITSSITHDIVLSDGYSISGTVTLGGKAVDEAYVVLYQRYQDEEDGETYYYYDEYNEKYTGEDGTYSFSGLDSGEYKIVVRAADCAQYSSDTTSDNTNPIVVGSSSVTHNVTMVPYVFTPPTVQADLSGQSFATGYTEDLSITSESEVNITYNDNGSVTTATYYGKIYKLSLYAGSEYSFDMKCVSERTDAYLRLIDANGNLVGYNDDTDEGESLDSYFTYTPETGGVYYLIASAYSSSRLGDYTLKIGSNAQDVTVTFDANGGSVATAGKTVTVGQTYGVLPVPTYSGYTFDGWFTARSGGVKVTASTLVTNAAAHTLFAHWTVKQTGGTPPGETPPVETPKTTETPVPADKIPATQAPIAPGQSTDLPKSVTFPDGTESDVTWTSADSGIARIDASGKLVAVAEGKVTLTGVATNGSGKKFSITVTIAKPVTKVRTPLTKINLKKGTSLTLPVCADSVNPTTKKAETTAVLEWKSSNPKVATVNAKTGKIKAVKPGTAKVTATALNGKKLTVTVKVVKKAVALKKIKVSGVKATLKKGKTAQVKIKVTPAGATNLKVTFKSSKKSVVAVDKAGRLTALKKGKARITVTVGKKKVVKTVTVK